MAGCRCPGRTTLLKSASAWRYQRAASPLVAAPRSTSRTSAEGSDAAKSWSMRTAAGCAFQSASVHLMMDEPVVYPAVCPAGRLETLAWIASCTSTTAMVLPPCDHKAQYVTRVDSDTGDVHVTLGGVVAIGSLIGLLIVIAGVLGAAFRTWRNVQSIA